MSSEERIAKKREKLRNRKNRKRRGMLWLLVLPLLIACAFFVLQPGETPADFDKSTMKPFGDPAAEPPEIAGEAAELYILNSGQPVYQKNADERIDPYSITKILTCYLALKNLDPEQVVKVSENAATPLENGTTIYLQAGEKISVKDLLYGAMLPSGNDAATALGEAVAGSEKEFAKLMNEQAAEWGCENTHFVNANGWKHKKQYTTAHDMAIIAAKSFENEQLREISVTKEYTIGATNKTGERYLKNHTIAGTKKINNLIFGKTGGWTGKDTTIVTGFREGELEGVAVVLRTPVKSRRDDAKKLIQFGPLVTPGFTVAEPGEKVCESAVKGGLGMADLTVDATLLAYPKDGSSEGVELRIERDELEAPVAAGQKAGTYTLLVDGREIRSGDLLVLEDVEKGGFFKRFLHKKK